MKKENIEIECMSCGHSEDILVEVEQNDEVDYDYVVDCSDCYGSKCPKCGEDDMEPSGWGGPSDYSERQEERRQMGLSNF